MVSSSARVRIEAASAFVADWPAATELIVVAATREAADDFCRGLAATRGATFGLHRFTLGQLASRIATAALAAGGVTPATGLAADALATRALFELSQSGTLGYLAPIADSPGLPRALAETLGELREAGVATDRLSAVGAGPDLAHLGDRYAALLADGGLADRAALLATATARLNAGDAGGLPAAPVLLLDVPITTVAEQAFLAALLDRAPAALATIPAGDARTQALRPDRPWDIATRPDDGTDALARVRRGLFAVEAQAGPPDESVQFFSAPGEGREGVEVARRILDEAARGVAFDQMAIVVRAPESYWGLLEQALHRAGIQAWFSRGTRRPDPTGRAFLALLACAADNLSARRFAEYLSLGQVPRRDRTGRADPEPAPIVAPKDEALAPGQLSLLDLFERADVEAPVVPPPPPSLERSDVRAPWRWESLLVDAAVAAEVGPSGRAARWKRRLGGLREELLLRLRELRSDEPGSGKARALRRDLEALDDLTSFALPLVDELAALPVQARWGEWLDRLTALAPRVLRHPARVLALLADLRPMATVGPVTLAEVRRVLTPRLAQLDASRRSSATAASSSPAPTRARPHLPRRLRPRPGRAHVSARSREDPLLLDAARRDLGARLIVEDDRVDAERLLLRLAVGAATERCYLSYPRLDVGQGRARVPSFYALDVARASPARCRITSASRRDGAGDRREAGLAGAGRPGAAIDDWSTTWRCSAACSHRTAEPPKGAAHYLLLLNAALARSVRTRWARWKPAWSPSDGLMGKQQPGRAGAAGRPAAHRAAVFALGAAALRRLPVSVPARRDLPLRAARAAGAARSGSIR